MSLRFNHFAKPTVEDESKQVELRRLEIECKISVQDAEALMALRHGCLIEKTRFTVPWRGHEWEVDVFAGENAGLVIAEIELRHEEETFDRPTWLGIEITGQAQYYNGSLSQRPFRHWPISHSAATAG